MQDSPVQAQSSAAPAGTAAPYAATDDEANAVPLATRYTSGWLTDNHKAYVLGSSIQSFGHSYVSLSSGWWYAYAKYTSSSAHARWWGYSPYYADQIAAKAVWSTSGIGVAMTVPFGVGFSGSGSSVSWRPGARAGTWYQDIYYVGTITEKAPIIYSEHYNTHMDAELAGVWYGM